MTVPFSSSDAPQASLVQVTILEGGVYVFGFASTSNAAVDDYVALLTRIYTENKDQPLLRFVIDGRQRTDGGRTAMPPLGYLMQQVREMLAKLPDRPTTRTAMVLDGPFVSVLDMMVRMLRAKDVVRMFKPAQFDKAVEWTLEEGK
jgi:hypothetical protein